MLCLPNELLHHVVAEAAFGCPTSSLDRSLPDYWSEESVRFAVCKRLHDIAAVALLPPDLTIIVSGSGKDSNGLTNCQRIENLLHRLKRRLCTVKSLHLTFDFDDFNKMPVSACLAELLAFFPRLLHLRFTFPGFITHKMNKGTLKGLTQCRLQSLFIEGINLPLQEVTESVARQQNLTVLEIERCRLFSRLDDSANMPSSPHIRNLFCRHSEIAFDKLLPSLPNVQHMTVGSLSYEKKGLFSPGVLPKSLRTFWFDLWPEPADPSVGRQLFERHQLFLSMSSDALSPSRLPLLQELGLVDYRDGDDAPEGMHQQQITHLLRSVTQISKFCAVQTASKVGLAFMTAVHCAVVDDKHPKLDAITIAMATDQKHPNFAYRKPQEQLQAHLIRRGFTCTEEPIGLSRGPGKFWKATRN